MSHRNSDRPAVAAIPQTRSSAFIRWLQDPMGSVVAATVAIIGSFGIVISGSWFIHIALN